MASFLRQPLPLTLALVLLCFAAISSARPLPQSQLILQPEALPGSTQVDGRALPATANAVNEAAIVIENLPGSSSGSVVAAKQERTFFSSGELIDDEMEVVAPFEKEPGNVVEVRQVSTGERAFASSGEVIDDELAALKEEAELFAAAGEVSAGESESAAATAADTGGASASSRAPARRLVEENALTIELAGDDFNGLVGASEMYATNSDTASDAVTGSAASAQPSEDDGPEFDDSDTTVLVAPKLQLEILEKAAPAFARVLGASALSDVAPLEVEASASAGDSAEGGSEGGEDAGESDCAEGEQEGSELNAGVSPKLQAKIMRQALFKMGRHSLTATSASST